MPNRRKLKRFFTRLVNSTWIPLFLAFSSLLLWGCTGKEAATAPYEPGWHVYRNDKYGYEIQYPDGYEVLEIGEEGKRDGAAIRIGMAEYTAIAPALFVQVYPQESAQERLDQYAEANPVRVAPVVSDVEVDGMSGQEIAHLSQPDGELLMVEMFFDRVYFRFDATPDTADWRATVWWEILSTFRFLDG